METIVGLNDRPMFGLQGFGRTQAHGQVCRIFEFENTLKLQHMTELNLSTLRFDSMNVSHLFDDYGAPKRLAYLSVALVRQGQFFWLDNAEC